jgi:C1A family cysteine protease
MPSRVLEPLSSNKHEKWMAQFGKSYKDDAEKEKRFQIFNNNVEFIELFNAAGDKPFNLSINHFADLTNEEFKASLNGKKKLHNNGTEMRSFMYHNVTSVPATMDWRKRGAVTPIKHQGTCGKYNRPKMLSLNNYLMYLIVNLDQIHQLFNNLKSQYIYL